MAFFAALAPIVAEKAMGMVNKQPGNLQVSTPVDRRMGAIDSDPQAILKQGKAALSEMDPETRQTLEPVFENALKRSAVSKQQTGGY